MIIDGFDDVETKVLSEAVDEFQGVAIIPYVGGIINDLCSQFGDPGVVMAGKNRSELLPYSKDETFGEFVFYWQTNSAFSPYNIIKAYVEPGSKIYLMGLHRGDGADKWLCYDGHWIVIDFSDDERVRGLVFDMLLWDGKKVEKK